MDASRCLITERELSEELKIPLDFPIRVFDLRVLGIDRDRLIRDIAPSYNDLPWDKYDFAREKMDFLMERLPEYSVEIEKISHREYGNEIHAISAFTNLADLLPIGDRRAFLELTPDRRRAMANFTATRDGNWAIARQRGEVLAQKVGANDFRSRTRHFAEMVGSVAEHQEFLKLLEAIKATVLGFEPSAAGMKIAVHQVGIVAKPQEVGNNSREGIHQDGADYIISALVIERRGVTGGESIVYGPDKKSEILRLTLFPGYGLFQADSNSPLWHYVTPVQFDPGSGLEEGVRNILGFDVYVSK